MSTQHTHIANTLRYLLLEKKLINHQHCSALKVYISPWKFHLPLNLISKHIRKQDCMISQTDSLVRWAPTGVSSKLLKTWK